jgi:peptidoglycan/LPS O-acetylase OafA/YrhL
MSKLGSFVVWACEMLCEAVGTSLWIAILALTKYGLDHGNYSYGYTALLFGIGSMVIIEFAMTGYLLTTLLAAQFLARHRWFFYPLASFGLYLIHSEIFFAFSGNGLLDKHDMTIQFGGACIAFGVTVLGNHLRQTGWSTPQIPTHK